MEIRDELDNLRELNDIYERRVDRLTYILEYIFQEGNIEGGAVKFQELMKADQKSLPIVRSQFTSNKGSRKWDQ